MVKVSKKIIKKCAESMMFELSSQQIDIIYNEFDTINAQLDFLGSIPHVDDVEPMTFPYREHQKILREDIPTTPLKSNVALSNSKTVLGNQIKMPKVIGNNNEME